MTVISFEDRVVAMAKEMWRTREPQSTEFVTDFGRVTITVSADWAPRRFESAFVEQYTRRALRLLREAEDQLMAGWSPTGLAGLIEDPPIC